MSLLRPQVLSRWRRGCFRGGDGGGCPHHDGRARGQGRHQGGSFRDGALFRHTGGRSALVGGGFGDARMDVLVYSHEHRQLLLVHLGIVEEFGEDALDLGHVWMCGVVGLALPEDSRSSHA